MNITEEADVTAKGCLFGIMFLLFILAVIIYFIFS